MKSHQEQVTLHAMLLLLLLLSSACGISRGVWVPCEGQARPLSSRETIEALIDNAVDLEIDTLFVQVYRRDRAWFASALTDNTPYSEVLEQDGVDPLAYLLKAAHGKKIKVHAWFNVFNFGNNPESNFLVKHGDRFLLRDRFENTTADYLSGEVETPDGRFQIDAPGLWIDPGQPEVQDYLFDLATGLVSRYPTLDGLHLDFIRYPYVLPFLPLSSFTVGNEFGHNPESLARYHEEEGKKWDQWKREQVTAFVKKVKGYLEKDHPRIQLSAAVISWPDRAYLTAHQDWRTWIEKNWVDFVVLMNYSRDRTLFHHVSRQASVYPEEKVRIGIGLYALKDNPDLFVAEINDVRKMKVGGYVLFSYDDLYDDPSIRETLKTSSE